MELVKDNRYYFVFFGLFLCIAGMMLFNIEQGDAIFFFSERRTEPGDVFFRYFTKVGEEWAYPVVILILIFALKPRNYRHLIYVPLLGGIVSLISYLSKSYFRHPRPLLYFERNGMLDQINQVAGVSLYGGLNSFPSGHTMSAFALYTFMALVIPNKRLGGILLLIVAFLVGLSRIYLVQHFLKDVYLGAIIGVIIGLLMYYLMVIFERKLKKPVELPET
ncbi:MAG: PAP2 family protein [Bacteroidetes bacterium]|nr:MAG: PAP2 family protein [Bacteroidota bacterium]